MAKGDKINIILDLGAGNIAQETIEADAAGREVTFTRDDRANKVTVEVAGRAGTVVRTVQYRADRVLKIEEVPR